MELTKWLSHALSIREEAVVPVVWSCIVLIVLAVAVIVKVATRNRNEKPLKFWQFTLRHAAILVVVLAVLFALLRAYFEVEIKPGLH
jgi:fumarate reductase subunit C